MDPMDKVTVEQRLAAIEEKLDLVLARLGMDGGPVDAMPVLPGTGTGTGMGAGAAAPVLPVDADGEILELVRRGRKIQAIKVYRERTRVGLREAKDVIDRLAEEERLRSGRR
ncbi:hypothetical protein ABH931_006271 [Streptacidiphilus sp. MAP12-33]|uniref:hypothetical protein n=1 Tax=Streptacidiphilus sp. MAP12-33 TaxID=3156266 RepID=UPI00351606ED